jgi:RHS repeat-associated protein
MEMPGRIWHGTSDNFRYRNNDKESDLEVSTGFQNYGMRTYDNRIGKFLSVDPCKKLLSGWTPYNFVRDNPILRVDRNGLWDITIHAFTDRSKFGYGIAILKNKNGQEVARYVVRLEGQTHDRNVTSGDTPIGVYDIPEKSTWLSSQPATYGPNPRLVLNAQSGEILTSGRSLIRLHGGRQESGGYKQEPNEPLQKTNGCVRVFDLDMADMKSWADALESADAEETPGTVTIANDLIEFGGTYYTPEDFSKIQSNINSATNITGSLLTATSKEQMLNVFRTSITPYTQAVENATQGIQGIHSGNLDQGAFSQPLPEYGGDDGCGILDWLDSGYYKAIDVECND